MLRATSELRWVASDYDLGGAFTKKTAECRIRLLKPEALEIRAVECGF